MFIRPGRQKRHAGRAGGAKAIELGSGAASRRPRAVLFGIGLAAAARMLRSRRFDEQAAVGVTVLVALAQMGRKVLGRAVRDLIAWDNARLADLEEQLRRERMAQAPAGAALEDTVIPARPPGAASRQRTAIWLGVGLVAAARTLRNSRFDEQVIAVLFALAALAQAGWKDLVGAVGDLIAWDNARLADLERELRRKPKPRPASLGDRASAFLGDGAEVDVHV